MAKATGNFLTRLVEEHGTKLTRFVAKRVKRASDAHDLAQQAYVRLLEADRQDLIRNAPAYLYRIAANLAYEHELRRRLETDGSRKLLPEIESAFDEAFAGAHSAEIAQRMTEVLKELPPKCKAVVLMHRRDGMTYAEMAAQLQISERMVGKYLHDGLEYCCQRLDDLGRDLSA